MKPPFFPRDMSKRSFSTAGSAKKSRARRRHLGHQRGVHAVVHHLEDAPVLAGGGHAVADLGPPRAPAVDALERHHRHLVAEAVVRHLGHGLLCVLLLADARAAAAARRIVMMLRDVPRCAAASRWYRMLLYTTVI